MPKLFKSAESHNSRIAEWKERLGTLGANPLPGDVTELLYQNHEKNYERQDKYSRITSRQRPMTPTPEAFCTMMKKEDAA